MSEAPERIWAWWDDEYDTGLLNKHGDKRYTPNDAKEYVRVNRIEELEAKLAKAVERLGKIQRGHYGRAAAIARTTLAELTGGKP